MFKSFGERIRIPISEALIIGASGGLLGWYGSRVDLAAIVGVLFLARFRGRGQSVVGAFFFSLLALGSAMDCGAYGSQITWTEPGRWIPVDVAL